MAGSIKRWLLAFLVVGIPLGLLEASVRSVEGARVISDRPAHVISPDGYVAQLNAWSRLPEPKLAIIGDSVAFGQVMERHGVDDWRDHDLGTALRAAFGAMSPQVVNLANNGLTPADMAKTILDSVASGAGTIVVVTGLRGFSKDFEAHDAKHAAPWRGTVLPFDGFAGLANLWMTRAAMLHEIEDALGAPLSDAVTILRYALSPAEEANATQAGIQALRMRRRLATVGFDQDSRMQARLFSDALRSAVAEGAQVVVVYATENPVLRPRMMLPPIREKRIAELQELVESAGATFLGPDEDMTADLFLDEAHLTPDGYQVMAARLVDELGDSSGRKGE